MKLLISQLVVAISVLCGAYCQTLPQPVHLVAPGYPELARIAQIQGTVNVRVHLGQTGGVLSMEVTGGHTLLKEEVERNIAKWRFQPGRERTVEYLTSSDWSRHRLPIYRTQKSVSICQVKY